MRRRLFTLCSLLSLVLCVAVCALWVRSYWVADVVFPVTPSDGPAGDEASLRIVSSHGRLVERRECTYSWNVDAPPDWVPRTRPAPTRRTWANLLGFGLDYRWETRTPFSGPVTTVWRDVWVPYWPVALAAAVLPLTRASRAARRSLRSRRGRCPVCGYDLRASPDRCPECGTPVKSRRRPVTRRLIAVGFAAVAAGAAGAAVPAVAVAVA